MKPQLVEYEKFFKKKEPNVEIVKHPKNTVRQIDNFNFYFNIIGLIILSIGIFILYQRITLRITTKTNYLT